ncbi:MAG: hypothetical protein JST13_12200, partial [Bacteroidetes bacterium]|nr:hypothetical protein [Bacteroidota bacterium]
CITIVACRLLAAWVLPTFDDAFITYRYALNFASGNGLVYNIGEKIMGTTAPFFAIISSIPFLLHLPVQKFTVMLNLLCDCASLYLVYKYMFNQNRVYFFLLVFFFAIDPMANRVSIGGMEADLFLTLSLFGLTLYVKNKKTFSFTILSAIYFLRPEAVILVFILFCYDMYQTKKLAIKQYLLPALVVAVPLVLIYFYYGQILPQSVVAKSTAGRESLSNLVKNIFFPDPLFFILAPLAVYGYLKQFKKNKSVFLLGIWALTFGMAYIIRRPYIWSWYPFSIEFSILTLASIGTGSLIQKLLKHLNAEKGFYFYLLSFVAVVAWSGVAMYKGRSGVETNVYKQLKADFGSDPEIRKKIIFADDIGAIGFFTGAYIYDGLALVTPQAFNYKTVTERIIHSNADYIFLYADPAYISLTKTDSIIDSRYAFYKRYSIHGEKSAPVKSINPMPWSYAQDYILLKKK